MNPDEMYVVFDCRFAEHRGVCLGALLIAKYPDARWLDDGKVFELCCTETSRLLAIQADGEAFEV